jgi:hypothetical protein
MDRADIYLELIAEQPILLVPFALLIFIFLATPAEKKLFISLVILIPWLTVARSEGLGAIATAAKVTSGFAYLIVAISAAIYPGPKRTIPPIVWMFAIVAFISIFYVMTTDGVARALVMRVQWTCVTIAGIYTARMMVHYSDLKYILNALTWGCIFALMLPISAFLIDPLGSFLKGQGRFEPWGANSNQIGMLFALAAPLFAYALMTLKKQSLRPVLMSALVATIGMSILTASRQTILATVLVMLPVLWVLIKRPIVLFLLICVGIGGLGLIISMAENAEFDRLGSLETGRFDIWMSYMTEVFPKRPFFGLLGTSGESFEKSLNEVGMHPHNAWLYWMYLGGLSLAAPMVYLTVYSSYCGIRIWRIREYLPGPPLLYSILVALLLTMYFQGIFNQVVYWPTYTWSFLHIVLAALFICIWHDVKDGNISEALYDDTDESDFEEYIPEEIEEFEDFDTTI